MSIFYYSGLEIILLRNIRFVEGNDIRVALTDWFIIFFFGFQNSTVPLYCAEYAAIKLLVFITECTLAKAAR